MFLEFQRSLELSDRVQALTETAGDKLKKKKKKPKKAPPQKHLFKGEVKERKKESKEVSRSGIRTRRNFKAHCGIADPCTKCVLSALLSLTSSVAAVRRSFDLCEVCLFLSFFVSDTVSCPLCSYC